MPGPDGSPTTRDDVGRSEEKKKKGEKRVGGRRGPAATPTVLRLLCDPNRWDAGRFLLH
jgi:hypothetical protein